MTPPTAATHDWRPIMKRRVAIVAALLAAVVSLVGAVVGGLAGMRYHRKVDRAGLGV